MRLASLVVALGLVAIALPAQGSSHTAQPVYMNFNFQGDYYPGHSGDHYLWIYAHDLSYQASSWTVTMTLDGVELTPYYTNTYYGYYTQAGYRVPSLNDGECHTAEAYAENDKGRWGSVTATFGSCEPLPAGASDSSVPPTFYTWGPYDYYWNGGWATGIQTYDYYYYYNNYHDTTFTWDPAPDVNLHESSYYYYAYSQGINSTPYCGTVTMDQLRSLHDPYWWWYHGGGEEEEEGEGGPSDLTHVHVAATFDGSHCGPQNTAPTADAGEDDWKLPAKPYFLVATIDDPDPDDSHTVTIDWGDGTNETVEPMGLLVHAHHKYPGKGNWTITVCVTDSFGESDCDEVINEQRGAQGKLPADKHPGKGKAKGLSK